MSRDGVDFNFIAFGCPRCHEVFQQHIRWFQTNDHFRCGKCHALVRIEDDVIPVVVEDSGKITPLRSENLAPKRKG